MSGDDRIFSIDLAREDGGRGIASAVSDQASESIEVTREQRELQKSRHSLRIGLAVLGESEKVADHFLESSRRFDFHRNLCFLKAQIPPIVDDARRDVQSFSKLGKRFPPQSRIQRGLARR
jgi:hypothetical protein